MNYTDVMLDLETLGNKSNAAILSIGAVEFNMETGETGREFYVVVDLQSCLNLGLKINGSTFYWWMEKSDAARKAICAENKMHLSEAVMLFSNWMKDCIEKVQIWGNAARFDIGLMEDAYVACGYQNMPWDFRSERDVRTLVWFAPEIKSNMPFEGIDHDPIDDCKHQIRYCVETWKKLNKYRQDSNLRPFDG